VDADVVVDVVADEVVGAIGPLISNSSRGMRFPDVGAEDETGLGRCFDDDEATGVAAAADVADTRAALADCGVGLGAGADFLGGVGRALVC